MVNKDRKITIAGWLNHVIIVIIKVIALIALHTIHFILTRKTVIYVANTQSLEVWTGTGL